MYLRLSVSGQVWMRNFVIIGATQKRRFGVLLSKKASRLKTFDMRIASGLFPRLFFACSIEACRRWPQPQLVFMITGYFRQAGSWIGCLIDGLERTSTSSAGS